MFKIVLTDEIHSLFTHAKNLDYEEAPDYNMLKKTFEKVVTTLGGRVGGPMDFTRGNKSSQLIKDSSEDLSDVPKKKARTKTSTKPAAASEKKVRK